MSTVSVIVPAYNAAAFVREAIDSALAQTVPPLEILVVDDGSTDRTREIVAAYPEPVRLLSQSNAGAARARNTGAAEAQGEWLGFLDADDIWLPQKLERQLQRAMNGAPLVCCDRLNIGVLDGLPVVHGELQPVIDGDVFERLLLANVIGTSGVLVSRRLFADLGGFDSDPLLLPAEDWDLWLRIAADHEIAGCREPLYRYRLHAQGVSRHTQRMLRARELVLRRALSSPRGRGLSAAFVREVWASNYCANAFDAARGRHRWLSMAQYVRALRWHPFYAPAYLNLARLMLGRL